MTQLSLCVFSVLLKRAPAGARFFYREILWSKKFGGPGDDKAFGLAIDSHDNILITGFFTDTIDFGGGQLQSAGGSVDAFVTKFTKEGMYQWSWKFGSTDSDGGASAGVDSFDNILVTGSYTDSYNGSDVFYDGFVAKYSGTTEYLWSKTFGSTLYDKGIGVRVDLSNNNIVVTGILAGSVDFGTGVLNSYLGNIFIMKIEPFQTTQSIDILPYM